jgi:hypothetical protein
VTELPTDPPTDGNITSVYIPSAALTGEIEFAIAYTVACNPGRDLLHEPDRRLLAEAIVAMLYERAGAGLSGMRIENAGQPGGSS